MSESLAGLYQRLILASTSPARKQLFGSLGIPFTVEAPGVDEDVAPGTTVRNAVMLLAERKARAVWKRHEGSLVVGSDQLVSLDGKALGKPANAAQAKTQLMSLIGRAHEILTGVCVVGPGYLSVEVDVVKMNAFRLPEAEVDRYVATGEWEGCAGSYRVEAKGQALFERIDGDRTSVQGLPMALTVKLLREAGLVFFS